MKTLLMALGLSLLAYSCSSDDHSRPEPVDENIRQEQQEEEMRTGESEEAAPGYDYGRTSPTI